MKSFTLFLLYFSLASFAYSDNFKVKLQVQIVDHTSPAGTQIKVLERSKEVLAQNLNSDGDVKLELEAGRLFEIWIIKDGYIPQVIHNVHAEGDGKYKITLYKNSKKVTTNTEVYQGVFRIFDDVKSMEIPAEYLAQGVTVLSEDEISSNEKVSLKTVSKVAKSQGKAQSKIDKYIKKRDKLDEKVTDASASAAAGELSQIEADETKLKLQKEIVKINGKLKKLYY